MTAVLARRRAHYEPVLRRIEELLPERPVVADVGCGPTCWTRFLPGTKVFADPLMHTYVQNCGQQLPDGHAVAAVGEALPLRSASCDLVFSVNALDHCANPRKVLEECVRITKPGGLVAISVYAQPLVRVIGRRLCDLLGQFDDPHPHVFTARSFIRLAEKCGLRVTEVMQLGTVSFRTKLSLLKRTEPFLLARVDGAECSGYDLTER